jgi:hypothetical protein
MILKLLTRALKFHEVKYSSVSNVGSNCVITIVGIPNHRILVHKVYWSYSADGAGSLTINDGHPSPFNVDITKSGPGALTVNRIGNLGADVTVTLLGIAAITGRLNVEYTLEHG